MKRTARDPGSEAGQLLFTYRRTVAERRAAGELRDVSSEGKRAGFRWPLAVTSQLWSDVETIPAASRRTETARQRWQHLFLLASPAAAQMQRDGKRVCEINVVLRTTDAPDRSREHLKTLVLRLENDDQEAAKIVFTLGHKGE